MAHLAILGSPVWSAVRQLVSLTAYNDTYNLGHHILAKSSQSPENGNSSPYIMCRIFTVFDDTRKPLDLSNQVHK